MSGLCLEPLAHARQLRSQVRPGPDLGVERSRTLIRGEVRIPRRRALGNSPDCAASLRVTSGSPGGSCGPAVTVTGMVACSLTCAALRFPGSVVLLRPGRTWNPGALPSTATTKGRQPAPRLGRMHVRNDTEAETAARRVESTVPASVPASWSWPQSPLASLCPPHPHPHRRLPC